MEDIRWEQRFDNYKKAFRLLSEIEDCDTDTMPQLSKEGIIQRFEFTFELAWKTIKDYLEYTGLVFQVTPRSVIKEAFSAGIIADGQVFIDMLEARNLMSHTYDERTFAKIFEMVKSDFYPALRQLHDYLVGCLS
jgi:nucleotidyltransferase substrate binding protein (TIGR01987 family)